jgi:hypothetical protein
MIETPQRGRVISTALLNESGKRRWFSENITPTEKQFNRRVSAKQDHRMLKKIPFIENCGEPHISGDSSNSIEF